MRFLGLVFVFLVILASTGVYGFNGSVKCTYSVLDEISKLPRDLLWEIWNYLDSVLVEVRLDGCVFSENVSIHIIDMLRSRGIEPTDALMDELMMTYCPMFRLAGFYEGGYVPKLRIDIYNPNDYDLYGAVVKFYLNYTGLKYFEEEVFEHGHYIVFDAEYSINVTRAYKSLIVRYNDTHALVYLEVDVPAKEWRTYWLFWGLTVDPFINRIKLVGKLNIPLEVLTWDYVESKHLEFSIEYRYLPDIFLWKLCVGGCDLREGDSYRNLRARYVVNVTSDFVMEIAGATYMGVTGIAIVDMRFWEAIKDEELLREETWKPLLVDLVEKHKLNAFIWYTSLQNRPPWKIQEIECGYSRTFTCTKTVLGVVRTYTWVESYVLKKSNGSIAYEFINGSLVKTYRYSKYLVCNYGLSYGNITIVATGSKLYIIGSNHGESYVLYVLDNIWKNGFTVLLFGEDNINADYWSELGFEYVRVYIVGKNVSVIVNIDGRNVSVSSIAVGSVEHVVNFDKALHEVVVEKMNEMKSEFDLDQVDEGVNQKYAYVELPSGETIAPNVTTPSGLEKVVSIAGDVLYSPVGYLILVIIVSLVVVQIAHYFRSRKKRVEKRGINDEGD